MIARGEVLERMTLVHVPASASSDAIELEALYADGATLPDGGHAEPVVFAGPHPRLGGNMDSPVLAELVWGLARQGMSTLRFNWRGTGASQGTTTLPLLPGGAPVDLGAEEADLRAAIDQQVAQRGTRTCAVVGYSVGALVAARVAPAHPSVERLVLISPPLSVAPLSLEGMATDGLSVALATGEDDVHASEAALTALGLRPHVIAGASHTFLRGLSELGRWVVQVLTGVGS